MDNKTLLQDDQDRQRSQQLSLAAHNEQPPGKVPGYDLERRLGEGAFGEVWLGTERNTGMRVAVKFYTRRGKGDWSLLPREVEKLAFLANDRRVVQLKAVGWDADPPYYVMEHLERGSLEDRLKEGPLDVDVAVELFREIAVALVHAHGKGVLHCDLKPGNVLLDQDDKPRLCDFGQSRLATEFTHALGTLFYMAPEQANLKASPDVRWDVYALGALLYCMLTGEPPYRTDDAVAQLESAASLEERLARYQQLIAAAPPLTEHRQIPGVDKRLAEILHRCLAVQPGKRYANVQAVLTALDQRAKARAQRPLLVLSILGPVLFLSVLAFALTMGFVTAIDEQTAVLRDKSLDGNAFAARFVGQAVGGEISRRWEVLEQEAADPQIHQLLRDYVAAADEVQRKAVQEEIDIWIERARRRFEAVQRNGADEASFQRGAGRSASWFLNIADGTQVGRHPKGEKTIGRKFDHRDYFHGLGVDYLPGTRGGPPIRKPHLSVAFVSSNSGKSVVAFSVPVFAETADRLRDEPLGVLGMTVELGRFTEIQRRQNQMICLIDTKPDTKVGTCTITIRWPGAASADVEHRLTAPLVAALKNIPATLTARSDDGEAVVTLDLPDDLKETDKDAIWADVQRTLDALRGQLPKGAERPLMAGRAGALLEHPALAELQAARRRRGLPPKFYYVASPHLERLAPLCEVAPNLPDPLRAADFADPIGAVAGPQFAGTMLAAMAPVFASWQGEIRKTGWVVVVQEQESQAVLPVQNLSRQLRWQALLAAVLLLLVVGVLWGAVYMVLRGRPRSSFLRSLRRRIGLPTPRTAGSATSSLRAGPLTSRGTGDATGGQQK